MCHYAAAERAKVFKSSFEYTHIYSPKVAIFVEQNNKITSLISCQRKTLRKTLKYSQSWDLQGNGIHEYLEYIQMLPQVNSKYKCVEFHSSAEDVIHRYSTITVAYYWYDKIYKAVLCLTAGASTGGKWTQLASSFAQGGFLPPPRPVRWHCRLMSPVFCLQHWRPVYVTNPNGCRRLSRFHRARWGRVGSKPGRDGRYAALSSFGSSLRRLRRLVAWLAGAFNERLADISKD